MIQVFIQHVPFSSFPTCCTWVLLTRLASWITWDSTKHTHERFPRVTVNDVFCRNGHGIQRASWVAPSGMSANKCAWRGHVSYNNLTVLQKLWNMHAHGKCQPRMIRLCFDKGPFMNAVTSDAAFFRLVFTPTPSSRSLFLGFRRVTLLF